MFRTEAFRRAIVVPLNAKAETDLATNEVHESTDVLMVNLDDDAIFYKLFEIGIFMAINRVANSIIDEHEEERLEGKQIDSAIECLESLRIENACSGSLATIGAILDALRFAQKASRQVYFIF